MKKLCPCCFSKLGDKKIQFTRRNYYRDELVVLTGIRCGNCGYFVERK